jgi:hypothetical protein
LFKNHNNNAENSSLTPEKILSQKQINSILYSDPFLKAGFTSKLVKDAGINVLYLDFDLLYSGYIVSGTIPSQENLILFQPTADTLAEKLTEILAKASISQSLIVIDSLNGLYNILNRKKDVGRTVSSVIMLIASTARMTDSYVVMASMVRFKKEEGWVLSPTGKRLIETENNKKILLEYAKEGILVNLLDDSSKLLVPANQLSL